MKRLNHTDHLQPSKAALSIKERVAATYFVAKV